MWTRVTRILDGFCSKTVCSRKWSRLWTTTKIPTINTIAYWNGAHSGTSSNLQYCDRGRFGTIVTKNAGDYAAADHTHTGYSTTDTKNTAGSSNKKTKIFVVGAASQSSTGVTTYSDVSVYITDGKLYASNFITSSDERIKTNIKEVKNSCQTNRI